MKKTLLILASLLAIASAHAAEPTTVDVSKLTPDQVKTLQATASQMATTPGISETARHETEKWAELGGNMGKAAVGAAKEIGMAANEFVATPLGRVTMGVVIYKVVGKDVIKFFVGLGLLTFFLSLSLFLIRSKKYNNVEYEYVPVLFGMRQKQVVKSGTVDNDWAVGYLAAGAVSAVIGLVVGLSVMF